MVGMRPSEFLHIEDARATELIEIMGKILEGKQRDVGIVDLTIEVEKDCYSVPEILWIGWMLGRLM